MAVITFGTQKGGPGKSTGATNMAVRLQQLGYSVILVDADAQRNSSDWAEYREENANLKSIPCVQKLGNVRDTLLELNNHYDFVIVDAAGRDSRELRTALFASHVLVMPFRPSQFDLNTIPKMHEIIEDAKDRNPNLVCMAYLSQAPTHTLNTESSDTKIILKKCDFYLMRTVICERKIYRSSVSDGMGVVESSNHKAKHEVQSFTHEILEIIEQEFARCA